MKIHRKHWNVFAQESLNCFIIWIKERKSCCYIVCCVNESTPYHNSFRKLNINSDRQSDWETSLAFEIKNVRKVASCIVRRVIGRIPWCFCCSIVFVRGTCTSTKRLQRRTEGSLDPIPIWSTKLLKRLVPMVYQQLQCEWTAGLLHVQQLRLKARPLCSAVLWRSEWESVRREALTDLQ